MCLDKVIINQVCSFTSLPFKSFSVAEVLNAVYSKNGKSAHHEGITIEHLKYSGNIRVNILTNMINQVFTHGIVPDTIEIGTTTHVHKENGMSANNLDSCRKNPVINTLSKIIEKLILLR